MYCINHTSLPEVSGWGTPLDGFHREGQPGWRRVDLSGSWISGEAAIFYVTRDVITGLWQIPDGPAFPASQCSASAAGTVDHKQHHYHCDTRGLHCAAQQTDFSRVGSSLLWSVLLKGQFTRNYNKHFFYLPLVVLSNDSFGFVCQHFKLFISDTSDADFYWLGIIITLCNTYNTIMTKQWHLAGMKCNKEIL